MKASRAADAIAHDASDAAAAPDTAAYIALRLRALPQHNAASLRGVRREISARIRNLPSTAVLRLAAELLQTRAPGSHVVVYELILHHPAALSAVRAPDLRRLGKDMASWAEVDTVACYVAGRAWRAGQIDDEEIASWTRSSSRWWRRAALVSTVPLNVKAQGGTGDAARTLAMCTLLLDDRDALVVKAMSWALRELAARDPAAARAFLARHDARLARRVLREVRSKLDTGRKTDRQ
jgi:3-methyladenine DNA glycosylase AlkD